MVGALKDPWSGNLGRIQIVKGWIDDEGEQQERIYYARVLEIPTPTGQAYDAKFFSVEIPADVVMKG